MRYWETLTFDHVSVFLQQKINNYERLKKIKR